MSDVQGTPASRRGASTPLSPPSAKSTGRRGRRAAEPLASIPSNIPSDAPMDDAPAISGPLAAAGGGPAMSDLPSLGASQGVTEPSILRGGLRRVGSGSQVMMGSLGTAGGGTPLGSMGTLPATPGAGVRLTPLPRPELGHGRGGVGTSTADELNGDVTCIWGTSWRVADVQQRIRRFYTTFFRTQQQQQQGAGQQQQEEEDAEAGLPTYIHLLRQLMREGCCYINVDAQEVAAMDPLLYRMTVELPSDVVPLWDAVTRGLQLEQVDVLAQLGLGEEEAEGALEPLQVRIFHLREGDVVSIRALDPDQLDTLVAVRGMVTRVGGIIPDMRVALFRCERCHAEAVAPIQPGQQVVEPTRCEHCTATASMRLMPNRCSYVNRQVVKMQEDPSSIPEGQTPRSLLMFTFDSNVDAIKPGDKVVMTGVFRAVRMRVNPRQRSMHAMFKTYLDILHVDKDGAEAAFRGLGDPGAAWAQMGSEGATQGARGEAEEGLFGTTTREDIEAKEREFRAMVADQGAHYAALVASVAPKVIHMDEVKEGLLCQLFGGVAKGPGDDSAAAGGCRAAGKRGDINVLVVGDPSVSKSQLLGFIHLVAPRGVYTSGKGSSAVGLTAYVTKDPETNELVLESGALVLSDKGICCIDEFDKMSEGARAMLHEVMEQQTVSVAKAGLVSQLNARTSILACANPKGSRYLPDLTLAENINLPPTLLSRFDLVYLVLDERREALDKQLAAHLVSLFMEQGAGALATPPYSKEKLREFVAYARARVFPKLSDEAAAALVERYKTLRQQGRNNAVVSATPRQLEALIRLSEAWARMGLRDTVTVADVDHAYQLWFGAMSRAARDAEGRLTMTAFTEGGAVSGEKRWMAEALPALLRSILQGHIRQGQASWKISHITAEYNRRQEAGDPDLASLAERAMSGAAPGEAALRPVSLKQMIAAAYQLPELISVKQDSFVARGGAAAAAGEGGAE